MPPETPHRRPLPLRLLPNLLTLGRLGLAAYFPFAPAAWWIVLVAIGSATDFLDGYIARRFNLTSWVGALLDGLADKAFTLVVLATLAVDGRLTWWELAMILPRDLAVAGIAAYLVWCRAWPEFSRMAARSPGKVTTVFVYSLMLLLLIAPGHAWLLLWPTAVLSVLAAVDYVLILLSFEIKRR